MIPNSQDLYDTFTLLRSVKNSQLNQEVLGLFLDIDSPGGLPMFFGQGITIHLDSSIPFRKQSEPMVFRWGFLSIFQQNWEHFAGLEVYGISDDFGNRDGSTYLLDLQECEHS